MKLKHINKINNNLKKNSKKLLMSAINKEKKLIKFYQMKMNKMLK
jgi:hypothetical protein